MDMLVNFLIYFVDLFQRADGYYWLISISYVIHKTMTRLKGDVVHKEYNWFGGMPSQDFTVNV